MSERDVRPGGIDPAVAAELPGLALRWLVAGGGPGPTSAAARARLRAHADRGRGVDAVALRTRPVPRAYRAFVRQLGLDPDLERIPAERVALRRLTDGGLEVADRIDAACVIAVLETGVGVWALDAAAVTEGGPSIRLAPERSGELVIADPHAVHAPLFADPLPGSAPGRHTRAVVLYVIGVPGVPEIHLHEALWQAADALA